MPDQLVRERPRHARDHEVPHRVLQHRPVRGLDDVGHVFRVRPSAPCRTTCSTPAPPSRKAAPPPTSVSVLPRGTSWSARELASTPPRPFNVCRPTRYTRGSRTTFTTAPPSSAAHCTRRPDRRHPPATDRRAAFDKSRRAYPLLRSAAGTLPELMTASDSATPTGSVFRHRPFARRRPYKPASEKPPPWAVILAVGITAASRR